jgi:hypothetical protein
MSVKIIVRPPFIQWRVTWHSFINCIYLRLPACYFVTGFSFLLVKTEQETLNAALSDLGMSIQLCGNRLYSYTSSHLELSSNN